MNRLTAAEVSTVHRRSRLPAQRHLPPRRTDPLAHDVVIVDETSMVSLPLMAHLLDAVRPDARLSCWSATPASWRASRPARCWATSPGPPSTPPSPGTAPGGPLAACVSVLVESYRFPAASPVGRFATAVRAGDADGALAVLPTRPLLPSDPAKSPDRVRERRR